MINDNDISKIKCNSFENGASHLFFHLFMDVHVSSLGPLFTKLL